MLSRRTALLGLILTTWLLAACGGRRAAGTTATQVPQDLALGKAKYEEVCAPCHGKDGKGIPRLGTDLTTSQFVKTQTDAQLLAFIKKGRDTLDPANTTGVEMPPKGGRPDLDDDQIQAIIAYIRTLAK